ncbi:MAG: UvrD-helicase domain-containing protein [Acidobacteria bacterium]|nr:UvrD-helicase domain-containing protein [Acidobacteriota bacterium]
MSHWQKIRDAANRLRRETAAAENLDELDLSKSAEFLDRALDRLELYAIPEHPNSANLRGALAVLEDDCVYYRGDLPRWYRTYCIAHELAHFVLHRRSVHCTRADIEDFSADEESASTAEKAVGYGAGERREREANLFALEFLLPCDVLRRAFLDEKLNAAEISARVEMPVETVAGQLARGLLVPPAGDEKTAEPKKKFELDASQRRAAETEKCPVLVTAGPGTGKTQTLTKRIAFLLGKGTPPKRILALTFSNKAAEEMRERVAGENPEAAAQIQMMTFHAFGLDILRSFWAEAGLEPKSKLLDKIDALLYLERGLTAIDLEHYQHLPEPTLNLPALLAAISRAKDELCAPAEYRRLAEEMLAEAGADDEKRIAAEKALETARVYDFYQRFLDREKLLDFGDLIFRAVRLLRENPAVRAEVAGRYDAILVDEFQDVNRACGRLLKEVAGEGKGLWAVGDLRQSIYRWRGASPANIRLFDEDFPDAETVSLEKNYRSHAEIVSLFGNFAQNMRAAGAEFFHAWEADRGPAASAAVDHFVAASLRAEAGELAARIDDYRAKGFHYKDQAVICRTHRQLDKFAAGLAAREIPVFYLGELFEREEVRDLLALLDLKYSANCHALVRVAQFPEYRLPFDDVRAIIGFAADRELAFDEISAHAEIDERLSADGRRGWRKLTAQLAGLPKSVSAWRFLADYLFIRSDYLEPFFAVDDVHRQARRLAVYQFLRLAQNLEARFADEGDGQIPEFLGYVKKLAWFNEDKNYAQIPAAAENLDAVRLLTVHSAKGLEFRSVFLPYLGAGKIPANRQSKTCPDPAGMIDGETDFHDEEEECLFFVAMSRARDCLHLSRALDYSRNQSKFLDALAGALPVPRVVEDAEPAIADPAETNDFPFATHYAAELDRYLRCPRQYFYTDVCGLTGRGERSVYLKFHSCVYETIHALQSARQLENKAPTVEDALGKLDEFWQAAEIDAHPYAPLYRRRAEEMIGRICARLAGENRAALRPTFELKLAGGAIHVKPDAVEEFETDGEKRVVVRRFRTGKSPKKAATDDVDALLVEAAKQHFAGAPAVLQKIFLSDDTAQDVPVTEKVVKNRLAKYEQAIDGINRQRFPAAPSDNNCPHCPHYFICPSGK